MSWARLGRRARGPHRWAGMTRQFNIQLSTAYSPRKPGRCTVRPAASATRCSPSYALPGTSNCRATPTASLARIALRGRPSRNVRKRSTANGRCWCSVGQGWCTFRTNCSRTWLPPKSRSYMTSASRKFQQRTQVDSLRAPSLKCRE